MGLISQKEAMLAKQAASEYDVEKILEMWRTNQLPPELQIQTQHSVYCEPWLWAAAEQAAKNRGKSRPGAIREFLFSLVSEHETDALKVKNQIDDLKQQMESIHILLDAKVQVYNQLVKKEAAQVQEQSQKIIALEQAMVETSDLLQMFGSKLIGDHYSRMALLSGKTVPEIRTFLKEKKYRPTEQQIKDFYMG
jgi:hypothetical protein